MRSKTAVCSWTASELCAKSAAERKLTYNSAAVHINVIANRVCSSAAEREQTNRWKTTSKEQVPLVA